MSPAIPSPVSAGPIVLPRRSHKNSPHSISRSVPGPWPASSRTSTFGCASTTSASRPAPLQTGDQQFTYIASQRVKFARRGLPIISIDTKKRELIGNFKNHGSAWGQSPQAVNDHDFRSQADGIAIPYGIYDVTANCGFVVVGTSHDTPDFAADNLVRWWQREGRQRYPDASELLVLADSGGSNAPRVRCFKYALQHRLVDPYQLTVTVCHYPSGASKWNPIDHRLFSEISKNWPATRCAATRPSSTTSRPPPRSPGCACTPSWSPTSITAASRYPMPSSLPSPSSPTLPNRSAIIRSVPGPETAPRHPESGTYSCAGPKVLDSVSDRRREPAHGLLDTNSVILLPAAAGSAASAARCR